MVTGGGMDSFDRQAFPLDAISVERRIEIERQIELAS